MNFIISMAFMAGVIFTISGVVDDGHELRGLVGMALLVVSWLLARIENGAESANGVGTGFFGDITTPDGRIMTKWITLFFPIFPVRSYRVVESELNQRSLPTININYTVIPLPGVGLYWPSVLQTAVWTGGFMFLAAFIIYVVAHV